MLGLERKRMKEGKKKHTLCENLASNTLRRSLTAVQRTAVDGLSLLFFFRRAAATSAATANPAPEFFFCLEKNENKLKQKDFF